MKCPACGKKTQIIDSRNVANIPAVRRRHRCKACAYRFTTYEVIAKHLKKSK